MKNAAAILIIMTFCLARSAPLFASDRPQRVINPAASSQDTAPAILSIIPAQAEPGEKVTIFGSNFGAQISAFLGSVEIPARVIDAKQIEFIVPQLDAGLYALYLKRGDGVVGRAYNFSVLPQRPVLSALSPDRINSCAQGGERDVTAVGRNFVETSLLFFDNASIKSRVVSSAAIVFRAPQVAGGLHQIMVKNPPENASVALALEIETRPEVSQVTKGDENVNYYELVIDGKNFQQNSAIYVDGLRVGGIGGQDAAAREKAIYIDCGRLIYQRFPYSPVVKEFRLQVVNPGNEGSRVVNVSAP
jgi:hypothetical protein